MSVKFRLIYILYLCFLLSTHYINSYEIYNILAFSLICGFYFLLWLQHIIKISSLLQRSPHRPSERSHYVDWKGSLLYTQTHTHTEQRRNYSNQSTDDFLFLATNPELNLCLASSNVALTEWIWLCGAQPKETCVHTHTLKLLDAITVVTDAKHQVRGTRDVSGELGQRRGRGPAASPAGALPCQHGHSMGANILKCWPPMCFWTTCRTISKSNSVRKQLLYLYVRFLVFLVTVAVAN